jgi:hypothetical protein
LRALAIFRVEVLLPDPCAPEERRPNPKEDTPMKKMLCCGPLRPRFTNQTHSVEVDIACEDITGDGCTAAMGLASLNLGVYTP